LVGRSLMALLETLGMLLLNDKRQSRKPDQCGNND
jgi:hypothetical protein